VLRRHRAAQSDNALEALGGGIIATNIAPRLSNGERRRALEAEYKALENAPVGQSVAWSNERGTVSGQVSAAQAYQVGSQNCRQYTHTVLVDGQSLVARGTAFRNEQGNWTPLL
jgi:surface antigen